MMKQIRVIELTQKSKKQICHYYIIASVFLQLFRTDHVNAHPKYYNSNTYSTKHISHQETNAVIKIKGKILDVMGQPAIYALTTLKSDTSTFASCRTDMDGKFSFLIPDSIFNKAIFRLTVEYPGFEFLRTVPLRKTKKALILQLKLSKETQLIIDYIQYVHPLISSDHPGGNLHFSNPQINHMAH